MVHACGTTSENSKTEGVGAILRDKVHWVNHVTLRFAHLLAMSIENETVEIDFFKWYFTGDIDAHHNHTGNPGEENIGASFHYIERIIRVEHTFGPVRTNNWPVGAREPGIKGIFVADIFDASTLNLFKIHTAVENPLWSSSRFCGDFSKHRDGDTPRDLTGNIPVFEILEVINQNALLALWVKLDFAGFEMFNRFGGELLDIDEPLLLKSRFDGCATFVTVRNRVDNAFFATEKASIF